VSFSGALLRLEIGTGLALTPDAPHASLHTMPFPKLSPLQSRLAASLVACILVLLLYLSLSSAHFAYATEVESIRPEDHNHERLLSPYILDGELDDVGQPEDVYEAEFFGVDRSIIGRAPTWVQATLENNYFYNDNVQRGEMKYYMVSNSTIWGNYSGPSQVLPPSRLRLRDGKDLDGHLVKSTIDTVDPAEDVIIHDEEGDVELRQRQLQTRTLFITINTCLQPAPKNPTVSNGPPGQLILYVSQTAQNPMSDPKKPDPSWKMQEAVGGFANITIDASGDVFIGVYGPDTDGFTDVYNVEVAASIDTYFHNYNMSQPNLYLVDSDSNSALLVTNNLTHSTNGSLHDAWMNLIPPFVIFAANQNKTDFPGIQNSFCGLQKYAQIAGIRGGVRDSAVQTSMTDVTSGPFPKQQFYFQGLNASSSYYGTLAMEGNSKAHGNGVVGGGGQVWQTMTFPTQSGI
jgi:calcium channel MID1